jgi:chlorobactene glucosyltransferase
MDVVLAVFAAIPLLHWLARLGDLRRRGRSPFRVRGGEYPPAADGPLVSVLIPARDEEANIERCLAALLDQDHSRWEAIVLDDHSSDATAAMVDQVHAADPRVRRVAGGALAEGWKGKPNALRQAAEQATGEWLLLIDADVELAPTALSTALGAAAAQGAEMMSWFAELQTVTFWERVLQPFIYDFILTHSDPARVNDLAREDAIANGQFILIRADVYREVGGHEVVRASIVEDMAFARHVKAAGFRYRLLDGIGVMRTRMYTSFGEIWRGWTKNFFAGLHGRPAVVIAALIYLAFTSLLPFALLAALAVTAVMGSVFPAATAVTGASVAALLGYRLAISGRYHPRSLLSLVLHPLAALVLMAIIAESARRAATGTPVTWKGRAYDAGGASADLPSRDLRG